MAGGVLLGSALEEAVKRLPKALKPEAVTPELKKLGVKDEELQMSGIGVLLPEELAKQTKDAKGRINTDSVKDLVSYGRDDYFTTSVRDFGPGSREPGYSHIVPAGVDAPTQNYKERIYRFENSNNVKNGSTHFGDDNYLMHTRVWDDLIGDKDTRVVGEVQSDLHQKGLSGREVPGRQLVTSKRLLDELMLANLKSEDDVIDVLHKQLVDTAALFDDGAFEVLPKETIAKWVKEADKGGQDGDYINVLDRIAETTKTAARTPESPWKASWARKGLENEIKQAIAEGMQQVAIPIKNSKTKSYGFKPTPEDLQFLEGVRARYLNLDAAKTGYQAHLNNMNNIMDDIVARFPTLDHDMLENGGVLDYLYDGVNQFVAGASRHVPTSPDADSDALGSMHRSSGVQKWYETNIDSTAQKLAKQLGTESSIVSKNGVDYRVINLVDKPVKETPEFKQWFSGSKITDESGQPKVLYHGTQSKEFSTFENKGEYNLFGNKPQFYFTDDLAEAKTYAVGNADTRGKGRTGTGHVVNAFLNLKNPANLTANNWNVQDVDVQGYIENMDMPGLYDALKKAGYDGVIYDDNLAPIPTKGTHYVAFDPAQIKKTTTNIKDKAGSAFKLYAGGGAVAYYMALQQGIGEEDLNQYMLDQGFTEADISFAKENQAKIGQALEAGVSPEDINEYLQPEPKQETKEEPPKLSTGSEEKQAAMGKLTSGETMPADELLAAAQVIKPNMSSVTTRMAAFFGDTSSIKEAEAAEFAMVKNITELMASRGVQVSFEEGEWVAETPEGPVKITPGILDSLVSEKGEIVGGVAGGIYGAVQGAAATPPHPWIKAAGAVTGGVTGAVVGGAIGTELDYVYQSMKLQEEMSAEIAAHKALTASEAAMYGEVVGLGLFKFGGAMWQGAKRAKDFIIDGNSEGARKALKETFFLSQDEVDEIVQRFERVVDTKGMSQAEKEIKAVATTQPGAEGLVKAASAIDPTASRAVVKTISERATQLLEASKEGTTETARTLKQDLDGYVDDVKTFYNDVKMKAASNPRNKYYKFNLDNLAVNPVLESLASKISDPAVREKFLLQMSHAQRYTDNRTFSDLIELRQLVNEFRFNKRVSKPEDYKALDTVITGIDEKLEKGANWLFGKDGAKQWINEFATARKQYSEMKTVQNTVLYKLVNRPGVTPEAVSKALLKYSDSIDGSYERVMSMLPKDMRRLAERDMISQLTEKYTAGSEGGIRATQFPMLAKDLSTRSFVDDESRQLVKAIDLLADTFKNDVKLGQNSGMMKIPEFQSYLTADPVVRAKFELASTIFNQIKQRVPGSKASREIALVKNAAKFLETPLNAKAVDALKAEAKDLVSLDQQILAAQRAQGEAIAQGLDQHSKTIPFYGTGKVLKPAGTGAPTANLPAHRIASPEIARQLAIREGLSVDSKVLDDVLKRYGYKAVQFGSDKVRLLD